MRAMILDTETNGKPVKYGNPRDVEDWPRITQVGMQIVDIATGEWLFEFQSLVKPNGWTIPSEGKEAEFFIKNNMSTERCEAQGAPIEKILDGLISWIHHFDVWVIVCHNVEFDVSVLQAEMIRANLAVGRSLVRICTMKETTHVTRIRRPGKWNEFKWPTLQQLYKHLFGVDFTGAHDALADVTATRECFTRLVSRGHFRKALETANQNKNQYGITLSKGAPGIEINGETNGEGGEGGQNGTNRIFREPDINGAEQM